jgi:hypothetical protein
VAQVKFWPAKPVGRPSIQQLKGAAEDKRALFFAFEHRGYTAAAMEWADANEVALFVYSANGAVLPTNEAAANLLAILRLQND